MLLRFIQHLQRAASHSALALCNDDSRTAAHPHKCPYATTETATPLHTECAADSGCMPCNFSAQSDWRLSHRCKITGQRTAKGNTSPQTSSDSLRHLFWQRPCFSLRDALRSSWNIWLLAAVWVNSACKFQSIYNCLPIFKAAQLANCFPPTPTGENARGNCHAIWCSFVANVCDDFIFPLSDDRCTGFRTVCPAYRSAAMGIPEKYRRRLAVCWSGDYCSNAACSKHARITGTFCSSARLRRYLRTFTDFHHHGRTAFSVLDAVLAGVGWRIGSRILLDWLSGVPRCCCFTRNLLGFCSGGAV